LPSSLCAITCCPFLLKAQTCHGSKLVSLVAVTFYFFFNAVLQEAANVLVEQYTHLRQRDSMGGGKATWRITVRQLESMIRLSEAMAKMECSDEVSVLQ